MAFFAQPILSQECDHNVGFGKKRQFFAENWYKTQKIVNITSVP
jgi:hypothetical protein